MNKFYVTGVAGMIASNVALELLKSGNKVIGLDNFWRGKKENIKKLEDYDNFEFRYIDLSLETAWADDMTGEDQIIHIADIVAGIGYVFSNEWSVFAQNNRINSMVASIVVEKEPQKIVYLGTACSYPQSLQRSVTESALSENLKYPAEPESGYGWSKLMGEIELQLAVKKSVTKLITLDLHNVYGSPCIYKEDTSQVIPALIWKAVSSTDNELNIWGDGQQGRAFVHTSDVARAILLATQYDGDIDCFMIGPSVCTTIQDVATLICQHPKINITNITYDLTKPVGDIGRYADAALAEEELGWKPEMDIKDGVFGLIDYIIDEEIIDND
jgi:nucleoside-diphosphate-sugar epimerase